MKRNTVSIWTGFLLVGLIVGGQGCISVHKPRLEGKTGYHDLMIRARRQIDGRLKGGRLLVKLQASSGMILFLSPVNQVVLKLEVTDGEATLFNPRRKSFWKGTVGEMMEALWELPLDWNALSALLLEGRVPSGRSDLGEWRITRRDAGRWAEATLTGAYGLWQFRVLKRSYVDKSLPRLQDTKSWARKTLREVAGDESGA